MIPIDYYINYINMIIKFHLVAVVVAGDHDAQGGEKSEPQGENQRDQEFHEVQGEDEAEVLSHYISKTLCLLFRTSLCLTIDPLSCFLQNTDNIN